MPTDGSEPAPPVLVGMACVVQVTPALSLTCTMTLPDVPPPTPVPARHCELSGTYTVPSGATLTWPCRPPTPQSRFLNTLPWPKVRPPSSLREQNAAATDCEQ